MGEAIELKTTDEHRLSGYRAIPSGPVKGGVVIVQEIFGVNGHIRKVCDDFAAQGYTALAPALFDRIEPGIELGYTEADTTRGRGLKGELSWDGAVLDVEAAMTALAEATDQSAGIGVGVVGYCYGGSVAWLAATRLKPAVSVCYYGGQIFVFREETPNCPVQMHFGRTDPMIPQDQVSEIAAAQAGAAVEIFSYDAGHGFSCDERSSFHAESTSLARERTLSFLERHLAKSTGGA